MTVKKNGNIRRKNNAVQQIGINNKGRFDFGVPYGETSSARPFHSIWGMKSNKYNKKL